MEEKLKASELHEMISKVSEVCNAGMSNRERAWFGQRLNAKGKSVMSGYAGKEVIPIAYMGNNSYMLACGMIVFLRECCVTDMTVLDCERFLRQNSHTDTKAV